MVTHLIWFYDPEVNAPQRSNNPTGYSTDKTIGDQLVARFAELAALGVPAKILAPLWAIITTA